MSGRQIFSESEKLCLQELIIKYKLNLASTIAAGNPAVKKEAWARLLEEYNSIESNSKRTQPQLKKCWDNLKTRKKALLAQEKKERMRTGGGPFHPKPGPSKDEFPMLIDEALIEQTDVELQYVIDSDNLPAATSQEILHFDVAFNENDHTSSQTLPESEPGPQSHTVVETYPEPEPEPKTPRDTRGRSGSRHTDYSASGHQTTGAAKNIRTKVITEEFEIRKNNYARIQEREEELHRQIVEEKQWLLKAAEEIYKKTVIERKSAEEVLRCNQIKREEAELLLKK